MNLPDGLIQLELGDVEVFSNKREPELFQREYEVFWEEAEE